MWLAYKQSKTNKPTHVKWLAELITSKAYESKILYSLAADFMGDTDSKWYSSKKRRYMMDELERIFKRIDICIKPEIRKEQGKRKIYERRRKMGKSCVDMSPAWRRVSSLRKQCHGELAAGPWLVSCICLLSPRSLVCRPHRIQAVPVCFLESELRPQPLSLCQVQTPMQYYLSIVGTLWSINTGSFPYIKCSVLTSVEEVRHILEPRRWSTEKGSDFLSGLLVQE